MTQRENSRMSGGTLEMSWLPTKVSRKPRNAESVPSVTISVGRRKPAMNTALMRPSPVPISTDSANTAYHGTSMPYFTSVSVVVYMANAAIAVKLTSMPPEISTISTPMAKMPMTIELRSRSNSVGSDRKLRSASAATTQNATTTRKTRVSLRVRSSRFIMAGPPPASRAAAPGRAR